MMEDKFKEILKTFKTNESAISQALGALVVVVVGVMLFNYFKTNRPTPEITEEGESTIVLNESVELEKDDQGKFVPKGLPMEHTVAAGDHLWSISEKYYGNGYNWVDIAEANNLTSANYIEEGMKLTIPKAALRWDKDIAMEKPEEAKSETASTESMLQATSYTVQKGDHLWGIALQAYGDGYKWSSIYEANKDKINHPNYIEIGMELTLPR